MSDDIAALIKAGKPVRTRDRRAATDLSVDGDGTITGHVPMVGTCRWQRDGRYTAAPGGGAGPLDLVPVAAPAKDGPQRGSVIGQLSDPEAKNSCCD
ncbi:MAG: hypothetical protein HYU58_11860 [Proteobacteria bacterium]|nr:hypothetical protein [Pseudomonadota bacterium]